MAKDVRIAVDMNHDSTPLLLEDDIDTISFNDIIYAKLTDAVRMVEMEAPLHLLEQGHQFGENIVWGDEGKGWLILPDDFMRLVVFKMSDWHHSVSEAITQDDPKYSRQWSKWKGVCGNPEKPVYAIIYAPEKVCHKGYVPKEGDDVDMVFWLQGRVDDTAGSLAPSDAAEEEEHA